MLKKIEYDIDLEAKYWPSILGVSSSTSSEHVRPCIFELKI